MTPNLSLPYLSSGQAQKHVTLNEALGVLDALAQLVLTSVDTTTPPASPVEGERHLVGTGAIDAWANHDGDIASYVDGAWRFFTPNPGWVAVALANSRLIILTQSGWTTPSWDNQSLANISQLGVNMAADATNRLAVSSPATLLTHAGDDTRLYLNRADQGDSASIIFETDYSALAEIGLAGDNLLKIRGFNGINWNTAITIDPSNGFVGLADSSPEHKLDVTGNAKIVGALTLERHAPLITFNETGGEHAPLVMVMDNGNLGIRKNNSYPGIMTAFKDGRVGIGVGAASAKLHVDGTVRIGSFLQAELPTPSDTGPGTLAWVTDRPGGAGFMACDGSVWAPI